MLNVYLSEADVTRSGKRLAKYVDIEFNSLIGDIKLNEIDIKYMNIIDRAEYYDNESFISSIDGCRYRISNLSTGCKVLILINHKELEKVVSTVECGTNVIDIVMQLNDGNIYIKETLVPSTIVNNKVNVIHHGKVRTISVLDLVNSIGGD